MTPKEELQQLVAVLSEKECAELLRSVREIAGGERFWENDVAILYNEYIKHRSFKLRSDGLTDTRMKQSADNGEEIFAPIPITKPYIGVAQTQLPEPADISTPFSSVVLERASQHTYSDELSPSQLSTLLHHACGVIDFVSAYGYDRLPVRTFPSVGALQAPEVYLLIRAVRNIPQGLYHYRPLGNALEYLKSADYSHQVSAMASDQERLESSALVCVITGSYERLRWKYGPRAYRLMCIDSGFLSENLCLTAKALGLQARIITEFVDESIEQLIGVDGKDEMVLLLVSIGTR